MVENRLGSCRLEALSVPLKDKGAWVVVCMALFLGCTTQPEPSGDQVDKVLVVGAPARLLNSLPDLPLQPPGPPPPPGEQVQAGTTEYWNTPRELNQEEAFEAREAVRGFEAAWKTHQQNTGLLSTIIALHVYLGDYEEAAGWCEKAVEAEPENSGLWRSLAALRWKLADDAIEQIATASDERKIQVGQLIDAGIRAANRAIGSDPASHESLEFKSLLYRAKARTLARGDSEGADLEREASRMAIEVIRMRRDAKAKERAGVPVNAPVGTAGSSEPQGPIQIGSKQLQDRISFRVEPEYPILAKAAKIETVVFVGITVDKNGRVISAEAREREKPNEQQGGWTEPLPPGTKKVTIDSMFSATAVAAVKQWRFDPYYSGGNAIPMKGIVLVTFRLPKE